MSSHRHRTIPPDNDNYNYKTNINDNTVQNNGEGQFNMNNLGQLLNNMDLNQVMGQLSQMMGNNQGTSQGNNDRPPSLQPSNTKDPRVQLLQAMKPFVNQKRGQILDNIGQIYGIIKIVRSTNKK